LGRSTWADEEAAGELAVSSQWWAGPGSRAACVPCRGPAGRPGGSWRLFLSQALEREPIGKFIYLDGDIEITGSLDRLAAIPLAAGQIATADDVRGVVFKKPHLEAQLREERRRLGMPESAAYFNTGVMLADMHAWAGISEQALKVFLSDPAACINLDQCAINAVCQTVGGPVAALELQSPTSTSARRRDPALHRSLHRSPQALEADSLHADLAGPHALLRGPWADAAALEDHPAPRAARGLLQQGAEAEVPVRSQAAGAASRGRRLPGADAVRRRAQVQKVGR
jgi:hypothetical protein